MKTNVIKIALILAAVTFCEISKAEPTTSAVVTTVVEDRFGGVGGVVADDMGYIYVSDFLENIWKLNPVTNQLSEYATGFYGASGAAFDKNGNLFQANFFGGSISRISRSGTVSDYATDGLAGPVGLVFDDEGNLIVCDCPDQSIKRVSKDGNVDTLVSSNLFSCPNGITKDQDGNYIVVSFSGSKIIKVSRDGEASVFADTKGNGVGHIVAVRGVFYATSFHDNLIYRITDDGEVSVFAGTGKKGSRDGMANEAEFSNPNGIAVDSTGTFLFINEDVGSDTSVGLESKRFSVRRIELPRLGRILENSLEHLSIDAAEKAYWQYVLDPMNAGEDTEAEIDGLGWSYLLKNQHAKAILAFELNAKSYANSWRAFNNLGAAYLRAEKNDLAIPALKRAIELNPENTRAIDRLNSLLDES